jgi:hypothetical protein
MRTSGMAVLAALMLLSGSPAMAGQASPLVVAQADKPANAAAPAPNAAPNPASSPAPSPASSPAPAAAPGAPQEGTAMKSAISTPGCYVKFLEAKVAGKLNGKKWTEFRREVCGEHETTAVFPTVIAPKYESEKDLDKARTKTCADQFTANKATNANGGLKWVEKDGGYYAECINRLKEG